MGESRRGGLSGGEVFGWFFDNERRRVVRSGVRGAWWCNWTRQLAVAAVVLLTLSLAAPAIASAPRGGRGLRSLNWLPEGVTLPDDYGSGPQSPEIFWDMYFGCEASRAADGTFVYGSSHGCQLPDLRAGDLLFHGDYEQGFTGYKIVRVRRDDEAGDLRVEVRDITGADLPKDFSAHIDFSKQRPLYHRMVGPGGVVHMETTDARWYRMASREYPGLRLVDRYSQGSSATGAAGGTAEASAASAPTAFKLVQKDISDMRLSLKTVDDGYLYGNEAYAATCKATEDFDLVLRRFYVDYTPTLDIGMEFGGILGTDLKSAHLYVSGTLDVKAAIKVSLLSPGIECSYADAAFWRNPLVSDVVPVSGIPVLVTASLYLKPSFSAKSTLDISAGAELVFHHRQGASWDDVHGWQGVNCLTWDPVTETCTGDLLTITPYNPDDSSGANLPVLGDFGTIGVDPKVSVGLAVELKIATRVGGVVGPAVTFTTGPKLDIDIQDSTHWAWALKWGVKVGAEMDLGIPFFGLPGWSWGWDIYNKDFEVYPRYGANHTTVENAKSQGPAGLGPSNDNTLTENAPAGEQIVPADGALHPTSGIQSPLDPTVVAADGALVDTSVTSVGVPTLMSPEDMGGYDNLGKTTGTLRPTFTWAPPASGPLPTSYQVKISQLVFETPDASTSFSPPSDLPPGMQVPWRVRACVNGRCGAWSDSRKVNIGITVGGPGTYFYNQLNVGNETAAIYDPRAGFSRKFKLVDIDSNVNPYQVLLAFTTDAAMTDFSGSVVVKVQGATGPGVSSGGSGTLGSDVGLFAYVPVIYAPNSFAYVMIGPYIAPQLDITEPKSGDVVDSPTVKVAVQYMGRDEAWQGTGGAPSQGSQYPLSYTDGDISSGATDAEQFRWTMSGTPGDRTMTVTLTDLFGHSVSRVVTVTYQPCVTPGAPASPTFANVACRTLAVNWGGVADAWGYQVQRSPSGCTDWADIGSTLKSEVTSYADAGLMPGETYCYRVIAKGCAGDTTGAGATITTPSGGGCVTPGVPGAPTFSAVGATQITLSWADVANESGYRVERSPDGSQWTAVSLDLAPDATTFTDYGLTPSTTYYYRVIALAEECCVDQVGAPASQATSAVTTQTTQGPLTAMASAQGRWNCENDGCGTFTNTTVGTVDIFGGAPSVEFDVSGSECHFNSTYGVPVGSREAVLYLTDGTNQVQLFRQSPFNGGFSGTMKVIKNGDGTITTLWNGAVLQAGISYPYATAMLKLYTRSYGCYDVSCYDCQVHYHSGYAALSTSAVTAGCVAPGVPAAPAFSAITDASVTVNWVDVENEAGYLVQRAPYGSGDFVTVSPQLPADTISYVDHAGLTAGRKYEYRIVALAASDCSHQTGPASSVVVTSNQTTNPGRPTAPTFSGVTSTSVTLNWTDVANETGYIVQRAPYPCDSWRDIFVLPADSTFYTDTGLVSTRTYCYRVVASSGCGRAIGESLGLTMPCSP